MCPYILITLQAHYKLYALYASCHKSPLFNPLILQTFYLTNLLKSDYASRLSLKKVFKPQTAIFQAIGILLVPSFFELFPLKFKDRLT